MGSPIRALSEADVAVLQRTAASANPFRHVLIDDFLDPEFARTVRTSWPSFEEASRIGRTFRTINERNKIQIADSGQFPEPVQELERALASADFVSNLSKIFGISDLLPDEELVGGGLHQTGPRGLLDVHVDFNYIESRKLHRRLNILIYFNDPWPSEWGGSLELWNSDVSIRAHSFEPIFNRCVIFETSEISYHGVTEVNCPPDVVRRSFAGYYYTVAAPAQWTGQSHSTLFKARPTESLKSRLMAVKGVSTSARQKVKSALRK